VGTSASALKDRARLTKESLSANLSKLHEKGGTEQLAMGELGDDDVCSWAAGGCSSPHLRGGKHLFGHGVLERRAPGTCISKNGTDSAAALSLSNCARNTLWKDVTTFGAGPTGSKSSFSRDSRWRTHQTAPFTSTALACSTRRPLADSRS